LNHTAINLGIPGESDQRAVGIICVIPTVIGSDSRGIPKALTW
jgi:hypothetical protein